jgi:hypothetical protein
VTGEHELVGRFVRLTGACAAARSNLPRAQDPTLPRVAPRPTSQGGMLGHLRVCGGRLLHKHKLTACISRVVEGRGRLLPVSSSQGVHVAALLV